MRFNKIVSHARITIEQSIGTLKMRFPYLLDELRLKGTSNSKAILACIALNNFIINTGGGYFEEVDEGLYIED